MDINFSRNQKTDYSSLFSGLSTSSGSSDMSSFLADYASLKNGSYGKLMRVYYDKNSTGSTSENYVNKAKEKAEKASTSTVYGAKETSELMNKVKSASDALKSSASKLAGTGSDSLFEQKDIVTTDENGVSTSTYGYDMKAIQDAVTTFVNDYNNLMNQGSTSSATSVSGKMSYMNNLTNLNKDKLAEIGITVGKAGRLTVDEKKLKEADASTVKSVFNGTGSYAQQIYAQANLTGVAAEKEAERVGSIVTSSSSSSSTSSSTSISTSKDVSKTLSEIEQSATELQKAMDVLLETGSKSVFQKENVTEKDEDGFYNTTYGYNKDKIYEAMDNFINSYNEVVKSGANSSASSINSKIDNLEDMTTGMSSKLSEIGITVGSDGQLSIDEKAFKSANMDDVKTLFNRVGSYGDSVSSQAFWIDNAAATEANKSNTYNASGSYTNNYSAGDIFGSYF